MNKSRFYLLNALFSGLIGLVVEIALRIYAGKTHLYFLSLLKSIGEGVFIGSVAMLFFFHVFLRLKKRPFFAFLSVFMVVAVFSFIDDIGYGFDHIIFFIHTKWLIVLIITECLGLLLSFIWYRQLLIYNQKLESKKAANKRSR